MSGLRGLSSLEAAVADGEVVTFAVVPSPSQQLVALMTQCLATKADDRPTVAAIITALQDVGKGEQPDWTSFSVSLFESSVVVITALVLVAVQQALLCNGWLSLSGIGVVGAALAAAGTSSRDAGLLTQTGANGGDVGLAHNTYACVHDDDAAFGADSEYEAV